MTTPASIRVRNTAPATRPNSSACPRRAVSSSNDSSSTRNADSSPTELSSSGFTPTATAATGPTHAGSRVRRAAEVRERVRATAVSTCRIPSATTGRRTTNVTALSRSTHSGDVAVLDCTSDSSPHVPCSARFRAYASVM
jgi:hypothetical protein